MKLFFVKIVLLTIFVSPAFATEDDEALMNRLCGACHMSDAKPRIAPPMFGVINHVKDAYPTKQEFVQRVVSWVQEPKAENTLMPGAVRRFGLMPKQLVAEQDLQRIAAHMYERKQVLPDWYKKHYKERHGKDPQE